MQSFVDSRPQTSPAGETVTGAAVPSGNCVLIIGASSSIARAVARIFASAGSDLILAGRDIDDLKRTAADLRIRSGRRVDIVPFDAEAFDTHESFWRECQTRGGGALAGVVMLHGHLPIQSEGQSDLRIARQAIDVNFISAVSVLTFAANDFEARKSGFLCVFSSVAGDRGRQSNYVYGSAKAALTAFLQGLRNRLSRSGVNVLTVKPGFVDTAMTWGMPGLFLVATPEKVAADVHRAIRRGASQIYTPWFWRYIMLIIKSIPEFIFKRLKM
ncbi:MAG TPA: SDR family oxidoreductase [Tepidisphaeraceae bacterium]|jgi:short-subunit dehydrogenase|nr:SDR family oxidoreductase [Tepidisphaeraceae bacterium]